LTRVGDQLKVKGWLQAPEGSGPRHAQLSPDGESLFLFWDVLVGTGVQPPSVTYPGSRRLSEIVHVRPGGIPTLSCFFAEELAL
jgi:hypothetical protein